ncbi:hypothetical protein DFH06DRAFT_601218 [Mycena polygramma]|nr:hypothetical protein DFH06DRAFT_601218 [Mycena polygramma]
MLIDPSPSRRTGRLALSARGVAHDTIGRFRVRFAAHERPPRDQEYSREGCVASGALVGLVSSGLGTWTLTIRCSPSMPRTCCMSFRPASRSRRWAHASTASDVSRYTVLDLHPSRFGSSSDCSFAAPGRQRWWNAQQLHGLSTPLAMWMIPTKAHIVCDVRALSCLDSPDIDWFFCASVSAALRRGNAQRPADDVGGCATLPLYLVFNAHVVRARFRFPLPASIDCFPLPALID